ncbi:hypothetical protein QR680_006136 [Steinernema hermaphroditum]|uniref:Uncharacterized protein n=1 Tax=Steinernema hermaphroditum TaxID=289476 RepID=A0AA39HWN4_9BILA|nr:hypothetical protein QR680_006136 [Steinernema hermaphroditum]
MPHAASSSTSRSQYQTCAESGDAALVVSHHRSSPRGEVESALSMEVAAAAIVRRTHFTVEEDDQLWQIVLGQLREKTEGMNSLPPGLNPLCATFWREVKENNKDIQRGVSTLTKKFSRMWRRQEFDRLKNEDVEFLRMKLGDAETSMYDIPLSFVAVKPEMFTPLPQEEYADQFNQDITVCNNFSENSQNVAVDPSAEAHFQYNVEFTMKLNNVLEQRDPELMRRWTDVCDKMGHVIVNVMEEYGLSQEMSEAVAAMQNAFASCVVPSAKKRKVYATDEERYVARLESHKRTNEKRRMRRELERAMGARKTDFATLGLPAPAQRKAAINESNPHMYSSSQ